MTRQPSGEDFQGVIGRTYADSQPWWPAARSKPNAPNVVMVEIGRAHV